MRPSRIVPCLVLVAVLAGCENDPEGPTTDQLVSPQFGATHMEMVTPQPPRGTPFIACANDGAGEDLSFQGSWWAHWSITISPSGNQIGAIKIFYSDDFKATGAESGDEWIIDADKSGGNGIFDFLAGMVQHLNVNEFYTNQDGEQLHIQFVVHAVVDEDFQPRMWIDTGWCPGQG